MKTKLWCRLLGLALLLSMAAGCADVKHPYVADANEPNDLPPTDAYRIMVRVLRDALPKYAEENETKTFYLTCGRAEVAALQADLPEFVLRHASESYVTDPCPDWHVSFARRYADDDGVDRVDVSSPEISAGTARMRFRIGPSFPAGTFYEYRLKLEKGIWTIQSAEVEEIRI